MLNGMLTHRIHKTERRCADYTFLLGIVCTQAKCAHASPMFVSKTIDPLAILQKSLDQALFFYIFTHEA